MLMNRIISYGLGLVKKRKRAALLTSQLWLDSLERSRRSFGLEGVTYEYWSYPTAKPEGSFWIRSNKSVVILLSEGFLKTATESQVVAMMESLNGNNFQAVRRGNKQQAFQFLINQLKGQSRHYRYWILSFFLYPLERFLKIAKI